MEAKRHSCTFFICNFNSWIFPTEAFIHYHYHFLLKCACWFFFIFCLSSWEVACLNSKYNQRWSHPTANISSCMWEHQHLRFVINRAKRNVTHAVSKPQTLLSPWLSALAMVTTLSRYRWWNCFDTQRKQFLTLLKVVCLPEAFPAA